MATKKKKKAGAKKAAKKSTAKKVSAAPVATESTASTATFTCPVTVCQKARQLDNPEVGDRYTCRRCLTLLQVTSVDPPRSAIAQI